LTPEGAQQGQLVLRPGGLLCFVGGLAAGAAAVWLLKPVPPRVRQGRTAIEASGMNRKHYRCQTCGLETTAGPLTSHQKASGHAGRERVA
jgi:hypothetical protein